MSDELSDRPVPATDDVPRAPGGVDADLNESDVGAGSDGRPPVTPDVPMAAQLDEAEIPDELEEPEDVEEPTSDEESAGEPTG